MPGRFTCASAYYPITYGQAPTLIMKTLKNGKKQLVASGYVVGGCLLVCLFGLLVSVCLFVCWLNTVEKKKIKDETILERP